MDDYSTSPGGSVDISFVLKNVRLELASQFPGEDVYKGTGTASVENKTEASDGSRCVWKGEMPGTVELYLYKQVPGSPYNRDGLYRLWVLPNTGNLVTANCVDGNGRPFQTQQRLAIPQVSDICPEDTEPGEKAPDPLNEILNRVVQNCSTGPVKSFMGFAWHLKAVKVD